MMPRLRLLLILLPTIGCDDERGSLVSVTGSVRYSDGTPIQFESGRVIFMQASGGNSASGDVEPDGAFTMMTERPGDGVHPGKYQVILNIWKNYRELTSAVPEKYTDPSTTPFEAVVNADNRHFDFVVEK